MTTLTYAQVAALVKKVGFPESVQVTMVAVCSAESGRRVEALNSSSASGLWQILWKVHRQYDQRKLLSDAEYNARAALDIYKSQGLRAWVAYSSGAYKKYENAARQGVAQAASVNGNASVPTAGASASTSTPSITYGPNGPQIVNAGIGGPLSAEEETQGPLSTLSIRGQKIGGDFSKSVIGSPTYEAGFETVPHLSFVIADPENTLLYTLDAQSNALGGGFFWSRGGSVGYQDLTMKMDEVKFEPGSHLTGQLNVTAVDALVFALMNVKGERTASGISATEWMAQEIRLAGFDPNTVFLGESVPSQSMIARDAEDQSGNNTSGDTPSAWTTFVRLAKELGKRIFSSGSRLIFGSVAFAMQWANTGTLRLSYHGYTPAERFLSLPSGTSVSVGSKSGVLQVVGRVPLNRAKFFRPGTRVSLVSVPSIAGAAERIMVVSHISHEIGTDVDGAEVTLLDPIDPPPEPPQQQSSTGANSGDTGASGSSGGGADGQIDKFVSIALSQAGKRYVFGAEASPSNANPAAFDCSELVEWAAARAGITPKVPDGSGAQAAWVRSKGTGQSISAAINTKGALLFMPGHVAISLGNGKTIEAMNPSNGVRQGNANGRKWTSAGKIPGAQGYR
jgi:cell wall-associated NlpC family hydrolase